MSKIDLSDPTKDLSDKQSEFLEYLVSEIKLNEVELEAKFGSDLQSLRNNLELRRISAEVKLERRKRKNLIDDYKLKQIVQLMPLALKNLVDIARNGKEHNRLEACKYLLKPAMAYLEKQGSRIAEIESIDGNDDKFNFTLNVTPLGPKPN